ncbi:hypothetical protein LCGC14_0739030 [marine sediment metagenome]|uniref:Methyltransferase type 11 domain-containing protein n=1 Tax=marine sediment metagenome TaxID=412755 RepID=A0A0F9SS85_9ZZZZ
MTTKTKLIELPFDQYQRYRDVQEIADLARDKKPLKVLDVGGHPGIIKEFLTKDDATIVDILPCDTPNYIQTDGSNLPFEDDSFDFVCSLDALEHVPPGNREKFLNEMMRVSKNYVVLICPFHNENIKLAEEITYEFYNKTFNAPLTVLGEHLQHGLPELDEIKKIFEKKGMKPSIIPSGYLFNWLPLQIAKIYIQSLPDAQQLNAMIDKFYNTNYYELDHKEPSYRKVLVASKQTKNILSKVEKRFAPSSNGSKEEVKSFDTFSMLMSLFDLQHKNQMEGLTKELEKTHDILKEKDVHISNQEKIINDRDNRIQDLERWAAKVQQTVPYKLYSSVKKLKKSKSENENGN